MNKNWIPIGGYKHKAWRLKKKRKKDRDRFLYVMDKVIRAELPVFMRKMAAARIGPFRPPIFDLIRRPQCTPET